MGPQQFQKLLDPGLVVTRPGLGMAFADAMGPFVGVALPADHRAFLKETNGAEGFGGYVRLFGAGPQSAIDLVEWNAENVWKFAWAGRVTDYLCFGETGWGDQFAYDRGQLLAGDPSVYFIEALAMQPQKIAANFSQFFADEFLPNCSLPYDEITVAARNVIGDLLPEEHVVYNPSPIIGGSEIVENIIKMSARNAMIVAGDLALGVNALNNYTANFRVEHFLDADERVRVKIIAC